MPPRRSNSSVTSEAVRAKGRRPLSEATAFRTHSLNRYSLQPASLVYFDARSLVILLAEHSRRDVTTADVNRRI